MAIDKETDKEEGMELLCGILCGIIQAVIEIVNQTPEIRLFGSYNCSSSNLNYEQNEQK